MPPSTMRSVSTFKSQIQMCLDTKQSSRRQRLMRETALNTKTIKPLMEERIAHLHTITHCYLLMPLISVGPVARIKAISVANVANLTSEATALLMGKLVTNAKVLITLKRCVIQRFKTGQRRALTRSHNNSPGERLQAAMAKEEASSSSRRRRQRSNHHRSREHTK